MQKKRKVSLKTAIILAAITFALVTVFSESLTGNIVSPLKSSWGGTSAPGKISSTVKLATDNNYVSSKENSQCARVGGEVVELGTTRIIKGVPVKLISVADTVSLISVNHAKKAMDPGMEKYVAGFFVTVFATTPNDACLIIK